MTLLICVAHKAKSSLILTPLTSKVGLWSMAEEACRTLGKAVATAASLPFFVELVARKADYPALFAMLSDDPEKKEPDFSSMLADHVAKYAAAALRPSYPWTRMAPPFDCLPASHRLPPSLRRACSFGTNPLYWVDAETFELTAAGVSVNAKAAEGQRGSGGVTGYKHPFTSPADGSFLFYFLEWWKEQEASENDKKLLKEVSALGVFFWNKTGIFDAAKGQKRSTKPKLGGKMQPRDTSVYDLFADQYSDSYFLTSLILILMDQCSSAPPDVLKHDLFEPLNAESNYGLALWYPQEFIDGLGRLAEKHSLRGWTEGVAHTLPLEAMVGLGPTIVTLLTMQPHRVAPSLAAELAAEEEASGTASDRILSSGPHRTDFFVGTASDRMLSNFIVGTASDRFSMIFIVGTARIGPNFIVGFHASDPDFTWLTRFRASDPIFPCATGFHASDLIFRTRLIFTCPTRFHHASDPIFRMRPNFTRPTRI